MTLFDHATFQSTALAKLHIWRCHEGCGFHLRAGDVVLTFKPEELAAFLHAAGACYLGEECAHLEVQPEVAQHELHKAHVTDSKPRTQQLASTLEH